MPGLYLAAPTQPPSPPAPVLQRQGLEMTWTGWDGSVWSLNAGDSGVRLLRGGIRGLSMPPSTPLRSSSPAVAGSRSRGHRFDQRECFWPLFLFSDGSSQDWVDYDAAFWRTMHPGRPGTWTVTQPNGARRSLRCTFADDGGHAYDLLPATAGWARYGVTLVAEQPFWSGARVQRSFDDEGLVPFFSPPGSDSVFRISSGSTLASARIPNPGNEEAWPDYTVHGPTTSVEVGVDGRVIEIPFVIPEGGWVYVDTDPRVQTAVDHTGADRSGEVGSDFAPVPPGESVALDLAMSGTGRVDVGLTPLHHRAW